MPKKKKGRGQKQGRQGIAQESKQSEEPDTKKHNSPPERLPEPKKGNESTSSASGWTRVGSWDIQSTEDVRQPAAKESFVSTSSASGWTRVGSRDIQSTEGFRHPSEKVPFGAFGKNQDHTESEELDTGWTEVGRSNVRAPKIHGDSNARRHETPVSMPIKSYSTSIQQQSASATALTSVRSRESELPLGTVSSVGNKMAPRPDRGKFGKPIQLIANYFLLHSNPNIKFYHYDVAIVLKLTREETEISEALAKQTISSPGIDVISVGRTAKEDAKKHLTHIQHQVKRTPGKQRCREIITKMLDRPELAKYHAVYDGQKSIYTTKKFPFETEKKYEVPLEERNRIRKYEITIKPVEKRDGSNIVELSDLYEDPTYEKSQEVIMVLDSIMNHRIPPFLQCQLGRSFFRIDQDRYYIGQGIDILGGYSQSVHLTERGPAVIVNYAIKAVYTSGSVIDYVNKVLRYDITKKPRLTPYVCADLSKRLKGVKVTVTHLPYPRKYTVDDVTNESARDKHIEIERGARMEKITVESYFKEFYGKPLRYPFLPCLHMRSKNRTTYIPFEKCNLDENQPILHDLDRKTQSKVVESTAVKPVERFNYIYDYLNDVSEFSGDTMEHFGLQMNMQFMQLTGRVIKPPALQYRSSARNRRPVCPDEKGTWRMDNYQFLQTVESSVTWMLISFNEDITMDTLEYFAHTLRQNSLPKGLDLQYPKCIRHFNYERDNIFRVLQWAKNENVTFTAVVIPPPKTDPSYEEVKFISEIKIGLLTQCVTEPVLRKFEADRYGKRDMRQIGNLQKIASNLVLKINSKLGGVNHGILQTHDVFKNQNVAVFGADAVHYARGRNYPSIAALVGGIGIGNEPLKYKVTCRTQENEEDKKISQEVILNLKDMVKQILRAMNIGRNVIPKKVIFFRDGVSEGQFDTVLEKELDMIQRAFHEEFHGLIPAITFIVVQKRHQTRFIPRNPAEGIGRCGNVPAGTTVDTDVVHPGLFDFFIASHEGIQGTSRPAHYVVLHDDNYFSADQMQKLCHEMCHMYARCNRSVSVPAPVKYADLACTRAKAYADYLINKNELEKMKEKGKAKFDAYEQRRQFPKEAEDAINGMVSVDTRMFFI